MEEFLPYLATGAVTLVIGWLVALYYKAAPQLVGVEDKVEAFIGFDISEQRRELAMLAINAAKAKLSDPASVSAAKAKFRALLEDGSGLTGPSLDVADDIIDTIIDAILQELK